MNTNKLVIYSYYEVSDELSQYYLDEFFDRLPIITTSIALTFNIENIIGINADTHF